MQSVVLHVNQHSKTKTPSNRNIYEAYCATNRYSLRSELLVLDLSRYEGI